MSSLEDRRSATEEARQFAARTAEAMASYRRRNRLRDGESVGVGVAVSAFAEAAAKGPVARAVTVSRGICIVATGFIPVALFWSLVWPG